MRSGPKGGNKADSHVDGSTNSFILSPTHAGLVYDFQVRGIGLSTNPSSDFSSVTEVTAVGGIKELPAFLQASGVAVTPNFSLKSVTFPSSLRDLMGVA